MKYPSKYVKFHCTLSEYLFLQCSSVFDIYTRAEHKRKPNNKSQHFLRKKATVCCQNSQRKFRSGTMSKKLAFQ